MENNNLNNQQKYFKILLQKEMRETSRQIDLLEFQIRIQKIRIDILKNKRYFWFQKGKKKQNNEKITKLEEELKVYYNKINDEIKDIYMLDEYQKEINQEFEN